MKISLRLAASGGSQTVSLLVLVADCGGTGEKPETDERKISRNV